jgi:hypothetical protein
MCVCVCVRVRVRVRVRVCACVRACADNLDCNGVGFTKVRSSKLVHGEVYSIQHYVIKFVSDLRQVRGFLQVF